MTEKPQYEKASLDWTLMITVTLLVIFGLVFVQSLSADASEKLIGHRFYYIHRQLLALALSLLCSQIIYRFWSINFIKKHARLLLTISISLLIFTQTPVTSYTISGAGRWINFGFLAVFALPLSTLLLVLFLAAYLSNNFSNNNLISKASMWLLITALVFSFLLLSQPDVIGLLIIGCVMLSISLAAQKYKFALLLTLVGVFFGTFILFDSPYRTLRVLTFLQPFDHMFSEGYQLSISLMAIAGGDFFGTGFENGVLNRAKFPGAFDNFAFASIAEEFGVFGILLICTGLAIILWRCLSLAFQLLANDRQTEGLIVIGFSSWLFFVSFFHMGINLGLLPTAGLPLAFISFAPFYQLSFILGTTIVLRIGQQQGLQKDSTQMPRKVGFSVITAFLLIITNTYFKAVSDKWLQQQYTQRSQSLSRSQNSQLANKNCLINPSQTSKKLSGEQNEQ